MARQPKKPPGAPRKAPSEAEAFPVYRDQHTGYHMADTIAAARGPTGDLELSALQFRNQFTHQDFIVKSDTGEQKTLVGGHIQGTAVLVETGVIRMSAAVALDTLEVLARHLVNRHDISKAQVAAKLKWALDE